VLRRELGPNLWVLRRSSEKGEDDMSEFTDKVKGKAKETVGTAKDDPQMENEGKKDRIKGETAERVKHEVQDTVERHRGQNQNQ
jgi:uncharacterized protein YjbJ (UPF0337 family)